MIIRKQDVSNNPDSAKKYDRKVFICGACDIWVTVELPIENK